MKLTYKKATIEDINLLTKSRMEVLKAANCRYFSVLCNVLFQINDKNYDSIKKELWYEVKKYRKGILHDSEARKKAKYAALISYFGYDFLKFVYSKTQYRGRKK